MSGTELMVQYASYHRDRRNIATHFFGIPLIVLGVGIFLARAHFDVDQVHLTAAWAVWAASTAWYLTRGNLVLGLATSVVNGVLIALAHPFADGSTGAWLGAGAITFLTGWVLQFIGHYYEGRKPAFRRRPGRPAGRADVRRRRGAVRRRAVPPAGRRDRTSAPARR